MLTRGANTSADNEEWPIEDAEDEGIGGRKKYIIWELCDKSKHLVYSHHEGWETSSCAKYIDVEIINEMAE